jgi:DNA repair photolyase
MEKVRYERVSGDYLSPRWSAEILDCSVPMTFDTYSNCGFGCLYCFSAFQRATGGGAERYLKHRYRSVTVERIKRLFDLGFPRLLGEEGLRGRRGWWQFNDYIADRRVIQWGGLSDPFCPIERRELVGLELLRFFHSIEYPISFSTKGVWFTTDDRYMGLIRESPYWHFKVSIITGDKRKASAIEIGVPSIKARLKVIERLAKILPHGNVTLRLRPFIIGVTNPTHVQLIRDAAAAGAASISTEFLCIETRSSASKDSYRRLSEQTGYDVAQFYRRNSAGSGYLRLNRELKRRYIDELEAACREVGMRFFVSDAHFKERCDGGSCCGIPQHWRWSRGQLTEAAQIAKALGEVSWSDIADHLGFTKGFEWSLAQGFNTGTVEREAQHYGVSMYDWIRMIWNSPERGQSPYRIFGGVLVPVRRDDQGDLVYQYVGDRQGRPNNNNNRKK